MSVLGIDFGDRIEGFMTTVSTAIENSASTINTIVLTVLHVGSFFTMPSSYLSGLLVSVCVNAVDIALGDKLATFISRFFPSDTMERISLFAALGLLTQLISPPFFAFGMGVHAGREITTLTSHLLRS